MVVVFKKVSVGCIVAGTHQGILACLHANWVVLICVVCFEQLREGQLFCVVTCYCVWAVKCSLLQCAGMQQLLMSHTVCIRARPRQSTSAASPCMPLTAASVERLAAQLLKYVLPQRPKLPQGGN